MHTGEEFDERIEVIVERGRSVPPVEDRAPLALDEIEDREGAPRRSVDLARSDEVQGVSRADDWASKNGKPAKSAT